MSITLKKLAYIGLAICFVGAVLVIRYNGGARELVNRFFGPFMEGKQAMTDRIGNTPRVMRSKVELIDEILELETKLANQTFSEQQINNLAEENEQLRTMLDLVERSEHSLLAARVVNRDPASSGRRLRLNRGRRQGVRVGQAVIAQGNLVARVLEVWDDAALALTITDPNCKVSVRITDTNHHGILIGGGDNLWRATPTCKVNYLPRDISYEAGMIIETSEYGGFIPSGIPVGIVAPPPTDEEMVETVDALYKTLTVSPYAFERDLEWVLIVIGASQPAAGTTTSTLDLPFP